VQYSIHAKQPLGLIFLDLNKAYDRVDRKTLWEDMANKLNIPTGLIQVIRNMYIANKGHVNINGEAGT
jgi:Reverse transcriptase (RNA-dependent DNA polymerase)